MIIINIVTWQYSNASKIVYRLIFKIFYEKLVNKIHNIDVFGINIIFNDYIK